MLSTIGTLAISAGTQSVQSGTVVFSNSNNVSFGMDSSSIVTAQTGAQLSFYDNLLLRNGNTPAIPCTTQQGSMIFWPLNPLRMEFPGFMTVNTACIDMSCDMSVTNSSTQGQTFSIQLALYTISGSVTLSLLNSVQTTFGFAANHSISSQVNGQRFFTIHSSQWSTTPVLSPAMYIVGINIVKDAGANASSLLFSWMGQSLANFEVRSGTIGSSVNTSASTLGAFAYSGVALTTVSTPPASIHISALQKANLSFPAVHLVFNNLMSKF